MSSRTWQEWRTPSAVTVPASGNTTLLTIDVRGQEQVYVEIQNATQALDAFIIAASPNTNGTYNTLFSTAADYTTPSGLLCGTSGDLTTLAAPATGWFILDVRALREIRLQASAASDSAAVTVYAGGS